MLWCDINPLAYIKAAHRKHHKTRQYWAVFSQHVRVKLTFGPALAPTTARFWFNGPNRNVFVTANSETKKKNSPRLAYNTKQTRSLTIAILLGVVCWHQLHALGTSERYEDGVRTHCWMLPSTSFHSYESQRERVYPGIMPWTLPNRQVGGAEK